LRETSSANERENRHSGDVKGFCVHQPSRISAFRAIRRLRGGYVRKLSRFGGVAIWCWPRWFVAFCGLFHGYAPDRGAQLAGREYT
jgi:hypothetical protein